MRRIRAEKILTNSSEPFLHYFVINFVPRFTTRGWQRFRQLGGNDQYIEIVDPNTRKFDESGASVIFGDETAGKYVEFVDPKTGETLANKKF